jgi:hypothetical protein
MLTWRLKPRLPSWLAGTTGPAGCAPSFIAGAIEGRGASRSLRSGAEHLICTTVGPRREGRRGTVAAVRS